MKDNELEKWLFFLVILFGLLGIASIAQWFDVPFEVMVKSVFIELLTLAIVVGVIALRIKEYVSLSWGVPVLAAAIYSGFTPIMNYKAVPFHSDALRFEPEFYGQSWFHFLVVGMLIFIGYGVLWYKHKHSW
jgi:hypothetical protein